ncbi:cob(I)yrinic acid a,c-diamide adenosyltransferase [Desulforhopalus singaporensis]|uniref:corrinoid adenosyltransferase n=1 Tax=Desulforhopalus singaporensis TaxID=91360 RepID=A0A1H0RLI3_9BACT|nr:cob(I)yrinic acid a,c-diamide adenosyltransferase [Desulforhopalus singaporensis]SDP30371.1 cob(I)yrinic acid a,c-diamide adenosyltransferase [Desulforhopalus singaporensis]
MQIKSDQSRGLLMVFTGNGKGKTTSAIGMAVRAAGHGMKVLFLQFIKGSWQYGEMESLKKFGDTIEFHVLGGGFTWESGDPDHDIKLANDGWEKAKSAIFSNRYQMIILDEFTYLMLFGMVSREEVVSVLKNRPVNLHLVLTGRMASREIRELADLVTEMNPVKHPFENGVLAQKGVEF